MKFSGNKSLLSWCLADQAYGSGRPDRAEFRQHAKDNLANYKVPRQVQIDRRIAAKSVGQSPENRVAQNGFVSAAAHESNLDSDATELDETADLVVAQDDRNFRHFAISWQQSHAASRMKSPAIVCAKLVQAITGSDEVPDPETRFLDAGLDSLMIVEMSSQIQIEVGPSNRKFRPRSCLTIREFVTWENSWCKRLLLPIKHRRLPLPVHLSTNPMRATRHWQDEIANLTEEQALRRIDERARSLTPTEQDAHDDQSRTTFAQQTSAVENPRAETTTRRGSIVHRRTDRDRFDGLSFSAAFANARGVLALPAGSNRRSQRHS